MGDLFFLIGPFSGPFGLVFRGLERWGGEMARRVAFLPGLDGVLIGVAWSWVEVG